jgi:hypothetical protein
MISNPDQQQNEMETGDRIANEVRADGEFEVQGGNFADGCAMSVVAALFTGPAIWMHWMLRKFADGDEWFDVTVRLILNELITALAIFAVMIIVHGFFAPRWLAPILEWSMRNMAKTVMVIFVLLFGSLVLFIFVYAVLFSLGVRV